MGRNYGFDGSASEEPVETSDFEKRFLVFVPDWDPVPSDPTPIPYSFLGSDDPIKPPTTLSLVPERFKINYRYTKYYEVYSSPPRLYPGPIEGPFDHDLEVNIRPSPNDMDILEPVNIFYTRDGSDPEVNISTMQPAEGSNTYLVTSSISIPQGGPTTIKTVCYAGEKEPSLITSSSYTFLTPGSELQGTIMTDEFVDGTEIFIGLFINDTIDLNTNLNPIYGATVLLSEGSARYSIQNIENGTYYLCMIADTDDNESLSKDDSVYPIQSGSTELTTVQVTIDAPIIIYSLTTENHWSQW